MNKPFLFDLAMPARVRAALTASNTFRVVINESKAQDMAEFLVYDFIGKDDWTGAGVGASDAAAFLADHRGMPINVRINSPGGLAWDGIVMHNALLQHDAPVTTTVEGLAASAATMLAIANRGGGQARMFENGSFMVHRAMTIAMGNRDDMQETVDWLDQVDQQIALSYAGKTGKTAQAMLKVMTGEGKADGTTMNAQTALEYGFINEILPMRSEDGDTNAKKVRARQQELANAENTAREREAVAVRLRKLQLEGSL